MPRAVGSIFGIPSCTAALAGLFDLTKIGTEVYWDNTNKRCTSIATYNTLIGVAIGVVSGDTIGGVRLNAAF